MKAWKQFCDEHAVTPEERDALFWHLIAIRISTLYRKLLGGKD